MLAGRRHCGNRPGYQEENRFWPPKLKGSQSPRTGRLAPFSLIGVFYIVDEFSPIDGELRLSGLRFSAACFNELLVVHIGRIA